jgi:hypothetical protein
MACCGLITVSEFLNPSELTERHAAISFHHGAIASARDWLVLLRQMRIISSITSPQSPTIGISARTFLEIELGSMSTWILRLLGENASILPVMRSSNRAPMQIIRSQSCIAQLAS